MEDTKPQARWNRFKENQWNNFKQTKMEFEELRKTVIAWFSLVTSSIINFPSDVYGFATNTVYNAMDQSKQYLDDLRKEFNQVSFISTLVRLSIISNTFSRITTPHVFWA